MRGVRRAICFVVRRRRRSTTPHPTELKLVTLERDMQKTQFARLAALSLALAAAGAAHAAVVNSTNITGNVVMGSGIADGGFSVATDNGVEIGLRARQRYPAPTNVTNNTAGTNVYTHAAGGFGPGATRAAWNFDWSINTGTASISAYTYQIGIDYNPGFGTSYQVFDPINSVNPNPAAGGLVLWDHSFGNNGTAQSAGVEAVGLTLAAALADYNSLEATYNIVQNSWNLAFFANGAFPFDPTANGQYSIYLAAFGTNGQELARSSIEVIVGTGAVPEPGSLALIGLALAGLAATRRRT